MAGNNEFHLHLISDSTGETLHALALAALAPFRHQTWATIHLAVFVRIELDLETALSEVRANPCLVLFSIVYPAMQLRISEACTSLGV